MVEYSPLLAGSGVFLFGVSFLIAAITCCYDTYKTHHPKRATKARRRS